MVQNTTTTPALAGLPWLTCISNHDIAAGIDSINTQIAYSALDPRWVLPARWYSRDLSFFKTSALCPSCHHLAAHQCASCAPCMIG